ncbi:hypothetical protein Tco_1068654 [Tanacetum coccineum]|uniref:Transmembrane protein n=1 Tax=Tanacetum coccineum TaxID=301880 RepID=A0ABQ5HI85_9ASTR
MVGCEGKYVGRGVVFFWVGRMERDGDEVDGEGAAEAWDARGLEAGDDGRRVVDMSDDEDGSDKMRCWGVGGIVRAHGGDDTRGDWVRRLCCYGLGVFLASMLFLLWGYVAGLFLLSQTRGVDVLMGVDDVVGCAVRLAGGLDC